MTVEERLDGSVHIMSDKENLKYKEITERPKKEAAMTKKRTYNHPAAPAKDHPWRRQRPVNDKWVWANAY